MPALRRWRTEQDAACIQRARRRRQTGHLRQSAGAIQQHGGAARAVASGREGPADGAVADFPGVDSFTAGEEPSSYANTYRDARLIVLEPSKGDADLFFPICSATATAALAEHAYQHTREQLLARADVLAKEFAHYGVKLNLHALRDPHRRLLPTARHVSRGNTGAVMSR